MIYSAKAFERNQKHCYFNSLFVVQVLAWMNLLYIYFIEVCNDSTVCRLVRVHLFVRERAFDNFLSIFDCFNFFNCLLLFLKFLIVCTICVLIYVYVCGCVCLCVYVCVCVCLFGF